MLDENALERQFRQPSDILWALDCTVPRLNLSSGDRSQCSTRVRGRLPAFQINGVPANQDLHPSNCNSAVQISPFELERLEVVRGATALFGAGAPGGIINLITRRARGEQLEVDAVTQTGFNPAEPGGSFRTDLYAGLGQRVGALNFYAGAALQDCGAGRDPDGNRIAGTEFNSAGVDLSLALRPRLTVTYYEEDPGTEYNVSGAKLAAGAAFPGVIRVTDNPFREESIDRLTTATLSLAADRVLGHRLLASVFEQWQVFQQRANFQHFNNGESDFFSDERENSTLGMRLTLAGLSASYGWKASSSN